ncbi:MAG: hypothetical protein NZ853_01085 [Leptospiraceae bacterium]|nr:hypothetical protein [Leptospiraceae bacterium]MDW7976177.1 hypothetical protein [Leptospiraceae bacterium]
MSEVRVDDKNTHEQNRFFAKLLKERKLVSKKRKIPTMQNSIFS